MEVSRNNWSFPGFSTFRFLTKMMERRTRTAIMNHVATTDSYTGIPPNTGIVNTTLAFNSSIRAFESVSVLYPSPIIVFVKMFQ